MDGGSVPLRLWTHERKQAVFLQGAVRGRAVPGGRYWEMRLHTGLCGSRGAVQGAQRDSAVPDVSEDMDGGPFSFSRSR